MDTALSVHRLHFAFTATFHYLFPQLTMSLALLILVLMTLALRTGDEGYTAAARFWAKIFGINFGLGVVTGIPLEFEFGTNWAGFSRFAGGVVGHVLAMEGMFAFFLESAFLALFLYGANRLSRRAHWFTALGLFLGSWASGYFIVVANAWMQRPVGYEAAADGTYRVTSLWALLTNEWAFWQYLHTMSGAMVTGSFAMAGLGAFYLLTERHEHQARIFLKLGVLAACAFSLAQVMPTGDMRGKMVAHHQPATLAAMEGQFKTETYAPLVIIGQPNLKERRLDNELKMPAMLSFLTYKRWGAEVRGLDKFAPDQVTDNIALLYYSYHVMVGLGTIFIAISLLAAFLLWRNQLETTRWMLWILMLSVPFPYIANTAGWMTTELGRQPWVVYGLMRTDGAYSLSVSAGNGLFTLIGFTGVYAVLSMLFLFLMYRAVERGPEPVALRRKVAAAAGS